MKEWIGHLLFYKVIIKPSKPFTSINQPFNQTTKLYLQQQVLSSLTGFSYSNHKILSVTVSRYNTTTLLNPPSELLFTVSYLNRQKFLIWEFGWFCLGIVLMFSKFYKSAIQQSWDLHCELFCLFVAFTFIAIILLLSFKNLFPNFLHFSILQL